MGKLRDILTEDEADQAGSVFVEHRRFIEGVAARYAPSNMDVPDIVQQVGVKICRGLNGFRSESEITTWLYRVTKNEARQFFRRERRHQLAVDALTVCPEPEPVEDPDEQVLQSERVAALREAIGQLDPHHQASVRNELADSSILLTSRSALSGLERAARHRARQRLKQLLEDDPRLDS